MHKKIDDNLCRKLKEDVLVMKNRLKTLDNALKNHKQTENAISEFESKGYFILNFQPYFVLGKPIQDNGLELRAVIHGYNGIPSEVRLEYNYAPKEYAPEEMLRSPCQEENKYHIKSAKQAYIEYFKEKLCLGISFRDKEFMFFRDVALDSNTLPLEIERFKTDLAVAKFNLDKAAERKRKN